MCNVYVEKHCHFSAVLSMIASHACSPRKFSRILKSDDKNKDSGIDDRDKHNDLQISPRGQGLSSKTTTLTYGLILESLLRSVGQKPNSQCHTIFGQEIHHN